MIKEAIATGDTVQEAYENACKQLGVETYVAEQEILEMPVKKTLGLFGGNPAKVRAFIQVSPAKKAADYLKQVVIGMGIPTVEIEIKEEEGGAMLCLSGEEVGFVIGHRGETLDALQYLAGLVANHEEETYFRITLDIGNYREKRRETLEILGTKIAHKALKTGRNCALEPMNPYERRIIHAAVQEIAGVKSWSEGEDLNRHIVIGPEGGEKPVHRKYPSGRPGGRKPNGYSNRSAKPYSNRKPAGKPTPSSQGQ
ncbi:MAG: protein jag [Clostridiales bacterium]|nr:protein jag [Clostridiales bacterium]